MVRIGLEAFAVFNGFEVIHLAGIFASFGIDACPHGDLRVDAEVLAMGCDGLRKHQNRNAEQAETAYGRQHWVGVGLHHFSSCELLLAVVDHS